MGRAKEALFEMDSHPMRPFKGNKSVCDGHFTDFYLKQYIKRNGHDGVCSYCGEKHDSVLDMRSFMDYVISRLSKRLCPLDDADLPLASSYLDKDEDRLPGVRRAGCYLLPDSAEQYDSISDLLDSYGLYTPDNKLNDDISSCFSHEEWTQHDAFGEDLDKDLSREWKSFVEMVKYKKRYTFFSDSLFQREEKWRDDVLTEIRQICESILVSALPKNTILYRGRPNDSGKAITSFDDLTSPPVEYAKENRMSAAGISVFYGAFAKATSIAEIRNYKPESKIDLGEFYTTKELTVVDLFKIPKILSFWMPKYYIEYKFLRKFHDEITKPALDTHGIEYVPTQIFTEYIRYMCRKKIDGIIYKSSLTNDKNIVLFYDNKTTREILKINRVFNGL